MTLPKITEAEAKELLGEDAPPKSCGNCPNAWIPHADPSTRICGLIGDSSIIESDRLNPDCPLINKSGKSPTKADLVDEIAQLRQDKAELVVAAKDMLSFTNPDGPYNSRSLVSGKWDKSSHRYSRLLELRANLKAAIPLAGKGA